MRLSTSIMFVYSAVKDTLHLYGGIDMEGATSCAEVFFQFNIGKMSTRLGVVAVHWAFILCPSQQPALGVDIVPLDQHPKL